MSRFDIIFLAFLAFVSSLLIYIAGQDLPGPNRSVAVQAFAAIFTMLITVGLFLLTSKADKRAAAAEDRAVRADARTERSEEENARLREASERQAASMQALAEASAKQADLLLAQRIEVTQIRLHLINVKRSMLLAGAENRVLHEPSFELLNMSTYGIFIQSVNFQAVPGSPHTVELTRGWHSPETGVSNVLLSPGDSRHLGLPLLSNLKNFTSSPLRMQGYIVNVECIYPGQEQAVVHFKVEWAHWNDESEVTITPILG